jgi:diguanylate cyclase (GGDEF)-like protein
MIPRYRPVALYSALLTGVAGVCLTVALAGTTGFPSAWFALAGVAFTVFVFQFGIPSPWVGLTSMERLPQVGLLLILPTPAAAAICAAGSFLWPLLNRRYSHGSATLATIRAFHNGAMSALMMLAAGYAYSAAGGRSPLDGFGVADLLPLAALGLSMQVVNEICMALFYHFDGRNVRELTKPVYSLIDLVFVPAGVLAAVLFNAGHMPTFALFMVLMTVFVMSVNAVGSALSAADAERSPFARLFKAGRALHGARRIEELGDRLLAELRPLLRFDDFYLVLVDRRQKMLDFRVHEEGGQPKPQARLPLTTGLFGLVVETGKPILVEDWHRAPEKLRGRAVETDKVTGSVIAVPLSHEGSVIGLVSVQHTESNVYSGADLNLLQRLSEHLAAAVADARAFEDLEVYRAGLEERVAERTAELERAARDKERLIQALREQGRALERAASEDPLTGVANRRHFSQRLTAEIEVAQAMSQPLTLAIADLDRFKLVNDALGHGVGDEVLRRAATLMQGLCRANDLVARIGGEEFALVLPGLVHEDAAAFCERLRRAIEGHDWRRVHPALRVTISIGVWQWNGIADAEALLVAADSQLYRAKRAGRNRVA